MVPGMLMSVRLLKELGTPKSIGNVTAPADPLMSCSCSVAVTVCTCAAVKVKGMVRNAPLVRFV